MLYTLPPKTDTHNKAKLTPHIVQITGVGTPVIQ